MADSRKVHNPELGMSQGANTSGSQSRLQTKLQNGVLSKKAGIKQ